MSRCNLHKGPNLTAVDPQHADPPAFDVDREQDDVFNPSHAVPHSLAQEAGGLDSSCAEVQIILDIYARRPARRAAKQRP